jgi:hypothetical protein
MVREVGLLQLRDIWVLVKLTVLKINLVLKAKS